MSNKGGSKVLTAILSFLIGFIFAIVVEAAAIFGVYWYATTADLDDLFGLFNIQNKDENGDYIYINTDSGNGGAQNLKELLGILYGYFFSDGATSPDYPILGKNFAEIEKLLPVAGGLLDQIVGYVDPYIDVDWDTFKETNFTDLPMYLTECVNATRPAELLRALEENGAISGVDDLIGSEANVLVKSLIAGAEMTYATTSSGLKLPVFYDTYTYDSAHNNYYRTEIVNGNEVISGDRYVEGSFELTDKTNADGKEIYRLYYVACDLSLGKVGEAYIRDGFEGNGFNDEGERVYEPIFAEDSCYIVVTRNADGDFVIDDSSVMSDLNGYLYSSEFAENYMNLTGNYFVRADETEIQVNAVTIGSLTSDPFEPLYYVPLTELVGDYNVTNDVFGSATVGEVMDGDVNFDEKINNLTLSNVVDDISIHNRTMLYIVYKVTDVVEENGTYYGTYDKDGANIRVKVETSGNMVVGIYDEDGNAVKGTTVGEISTIADELAMTVVLDVKASDAILTYIGYGITGLRPEAGDGYSYVGKYKVDDVTYTCYVSTDAEGKIASAWYSDGGQTVEIKPTNIHDLSDRMSDVTSNITLGGVVDVKIDNAIMAYMGYGISDIAKAPDGAAYDYTAKYDDNGVERTVYVDTDDAGKIISVWYEDAGNKLYLDGTAIDQISDRMDGIKKELTVGEILGESLDESDKILWALRDSTIETLGSDVKQLKVGDVIEVTDDSSNILKQLQNKKIEELSTAIDEITIQSIYANEIYGTNELTAATTYDAEQLYYIDGGEDGYVLVNGTGKLTDEQIASWGEDGVTYYSYGRAQGMWKFALYAGGEEQAYTINMMDFLMANSKVNVGNATLRDLAEVGVLNIKEEDLNKKLNGTALGEIVLQDLIDIVIGMATD